MKLRATSIIAKNFVGGGGALIALVIRVLAGDNLGVKDAGDDDIAERTGEIE